MYSTVSTLKPGGKHRGRAREARRWCCACGWPREKISCARTNGGNGGHDFAQLQLVQDGRLAGRVKPHLEGGQEPVARQSPVFRAASKFDTPRPEGRPGARPAVATPGNSAALREEAARGCGALQRRKLSELPCPQRPTLAAPRAARLGTRHEDAHLALAEQPREQLRREAASSATVSRSNWHQQHTRLGEGEPHGCRTRERAHKRQRLGVGTENAAQAGPPR